MARPRLRGPAVVAEQDPSRLCFPIRLPGRHARRAPDGRRRARPPSTALIADVVIPFNGVLVTRELVERIGLPREEFFIWGDDVEYLWRARAAGARIATVVARALPAPGDGRPRHADDVRPDDVQPLALATSSTTAWPQQPASTCASTRLPGALAFVVEDAVVLHVHPPEPGPAPAEPRARWSPAARRLHRPREVPPWLRSRQLAPGGSTAARPSPSSSSPTTGPTCWPDARRPGRPDPAARRRDRGRQRQHRPHAAGARGAHGDLPLLAIHERGEPRRRRRLPPRRAGRRTTGASTGSG